MRFNELRRSVRRWPRQDGSLMETFGLAPESQVGEPRPKVLEDG